MQQFHWVLSSVVGLTWLIGACSGAALPEYSFQAPFDRVDAQGNRYINASWSHGGHTDVMKNFVRLTTDRQSKRGHIWHRQPLNRDTFSAVLQFRISGQGKKWFGDGIGFWLTNNPLHVNGDNHGFKSDYTGVGIILDTFINPEHAGGHKDVTLQINDGHKSLDMLNDEKKVGCDSAFRFHEKSADFNPVFSSSRLRISIDRTKIKLEMDPKSQAEWTVCYEGELPLSQDWLRSATIGITAATGGLADNHDILSLSSFEEYSDPNIHIADAEVYWNNYSKEHSKIMDSEDCGQSCKMLILDKQMSNFHIEMEHQLTDLKEKTMHTIKKINEREHVNHDRLVELEQKMFQMMDSKISDSVKNLNTYVDADLEHQIRTKVEKQSGWKTPFFLLLVGLSGVFFFVYRKYQELRKSHLL